MGQKAILNYIKHCLILLCTFFSWYGTLQASAKEVAYDIPSEIKQLNDLGSVDLSGNIGDKLLQYAVKEEDVVFFKKLLLYSAKKKQGHQLKLNTETAYKAFIWLIGEDKESFKECMEYNAQHHNENQFNLNKHNGKLAICILKKKDKHRFKYLLKSYSKKDSDYEYTNDYNQNPEYELDFSNSKIGPPILREAIKVDTRDEISLYRNYTKFVTTVLRYDPQKSSHQFNLRSDEAHQEIIYTIKKHWVKGVKKLLKYKPKGSQSDSYKVDINKTDKKSGDTLLHVAIGELQQNPNNQYTEKCQLIIKAILQHDGINVNIVNEDTKVPIQLLEEEYRDELYKKLDDSFKEMLESSLPKNENDNSVSSNEKNNNDEIKIDLSDKKYEKDNTQVPTKRQEEYDFADYDSENNTYSRNDKESNPANNINENPISSKSNLNKNSREHNSDNINKGLKNFSKDNILNSEEEDPNNIKNEKVIKPLQKRKQEDLIDSGKIEIVKKNELFEEGNKKNEYSDNGNGNNNTKINIEKNKEQLNNSNNRRIEKPKKSELFNNRNAITIPKENDLLSNQNEYSYFNSDNKNSIKEQKININTEEENDDNSNKGKLLDNANNNQLINNESDNINQSKKSSIFNIKNVKKGIFIILVIVILGVITDYFYIKEKFKSAVNEQGS